MNAMQQTTGLAEALIGTAIAAYTSGLDGDREAVPYITIEVRVPMPVALAIRYHPTATEAEDVLWVESFCRVCGCTEDSACEGGCAWADDGELCTRCAPQVKSGVV